MGCAVEAEELAAGSCSSPRSACGHSHGDALPRPPRRCNSTSCPLRRIQATLPKLQSAGSTMGTALPVWGQLHEHGQGNEERTQNWAHTAPPPRSRALSQLVLREETGPALQCFIPARMSNKALIMLFFQLVLEQQLATKICKSVGTLQRGKKRSAGLLANLPVLSGPSASPDPLQAGPHIDVHQRETLKAAVRMLIPCPILHPMQLC